MLLSLRKQWNERSFRRSAYLGPSVYNSPSINFAEYERSCDRTEMPSKHKKVEVAKIDVETIFNKHKIEPSYPLSHKQSASNSVRDPSHKQSYYVEENEIMSIDGFFDVYQGMMAHQKNQQKVGYKKELQKKRQKIEEIHSATIKPLARSTTMSVADLFNPSKNASEVAQSPKATGLSALLRTNSLSHSKFIPVVIPYSPKNGESHGFQSGEKTPTSPVQQKRLERRYTKGMSMDYSMTKGMTSEQKFTEKEIDKHLVRIMVSPKFMKHTVTPSQKEKSYGVMFKDPKTMDSAVENSIRKANRLSIKCHTASQSYRAQPTPDEMSAGVTISHRKAEEVREKDAPVEESHIGTVTGESETQKGIIIGRRIKENISRIEKILRASSLEQTSSQSPKPSGRTTVKQWVRVKNKYPLRSTIATKYQLKEKILDHKTVATKIKDVSKALKKEAKESSIKTQAYSSYYH